MKKLHSFAFYALATPIMTFGAGSVLAQQSADQDIYGQEESANQETYGQEESANQETYGQEDSADQEMYGQEESADQEMYGQEQGTERDQGAKHSSPVVTEGDQSTPGAGEYDSQAAVESENTSSDQSEENRGFLSSAPANGMQASNLIGAEVKTSAGEDVGPVTDLIIDDENHIVAIVVSVGGFLGMGEREVAIGWDDVTTSVDSDLLTSDDLELQIDATREDLSAAPEFNKQD